MTTVSNASELLSALATASEGDVITWLPATMAT